MPRTWLVTGAARGIGVEIVKAALAAGDRVVATVRTPRNIEQTFVGESDRLLVLPLDVTREDQVKDAVDAAVKKFRTMDVLVNNAGYGQLGVFEETTPEQIRDQFDTNVFGLMAVTRAVIPIMRKQRSGRVFNLSSMAGLRGIFGVSAYNATKFAVEGFSQALAQELSPFGVFVTVISPGFFRTDFLDQSSAKYSEGESISDYAKPLSDFRAFMENRNHNQAGDPAKLASLIVRLAQIEKPPVSFVVGSDAVEVATNVIKARQEQIDQWRELSVSTDGNWATATAP
jgi:NAD(P)-dependent dehydrogenase (short-subunit alcohol dehydrogenase family)